MRQVGNKFSGSCCALGSRPRQKKNLSVLVRIANKSDNGKRITGGPASSSWDVCRLLIRAWMNIADEFQLRAFVESKPEIQLIAEERKPRIRSRASQENEVVIGFQIG